MAEIKRYKSQLELELKYCPRVMHSNQSYLSVVYMFAPHSCDIFQSVQINGLLACHWLSLSLKAIIGLRTVGIYKLKYLRSYDTGGSSSPVDWSCNCYFHLYTHFTVVN